MHRLKAGVDRVEAETGEGRAPAGAAEGLTMADPAAVMPVAADPQTPKVAQDAS